MNNDFAIDKVKSIRISFVEEDKKTEIVWHNVIPNTTSLYFDYGDHVCWKSDWNGTYCTTVNTDRKMNLGFYARPVMIDGEEVLFTLTQTDLESADTLHEEDYTEIESFLSGFRIKDGE